MTPRVNFTAPGDDNRTEVWRVNTDFSGAETRKGTLRLRSGPGTKYKVLATYKNGSFVQVICKTNSSWYEVTAPDGKHGYRRTGSGLSVFSYNHTEKDKQEGRMAGTGRLSSKIKFEYIRKRISSNADGRKAGN